MTCPERHYRGAGRRDYHCDDAQSAEVPVLSCRGNSIRQDGVPGQASYRKIQPSHYGSRLGVLVTV